MKETLTPEQFRSALHKGLGRAVLHVREYGDDHVRQHLLDACLQARSYDPQIEGGRAEWLLQMIDATSGADIYRNEILAALEVVEEGTGNAVWDAKQLCDFALHYARRGHERGRELLYRIYREDRFSDASWIAADQILALDGLDGLSFLAKVAGERILAGDCVDEYDAALPRACEEFGSLQVLARLEKASVQSAEVSAFLEQVAEAIERRATSAKVKRLHRKVPSCDDIIEAIDEARWRYPGQYRWFGKDATSEELRAVFERLLAEQELESVLRCLWVFGSRELPELTPRVFALLDSDDERLREAAESALANSADPRVRRAAVERLAEPTSVSDLIGAIQMLRKNYRTEDSVLILRCLPCGESNSEDARWRNHCIGTALIDLAENNPDTALVPCLSWLYEKSPCSICRTRAVKCLVGWDAFSEELRYECRFDVAEGIRELVTKQ